MLHNYEVFQNPYLATVFYLIWYDYQLEIVLGKLTEKTIETTMLTCGEVIIGGCNQAKFTLLPTSGVSFEGVPLFGAWFVIS